MAEMQAFVPAEVSLLAEGRILAEGTEAMCFGASGRETRSRWLHLFVFRDGLILSATEWNEAAVLAAACRGD